MNRDVATQERVTEKEEIDIGSHYSEDTGSLTLFSKFNHIALRWNIVVHISQLELQVVQLSISVRASTLNKANNLACLCLNTIDTFGSHLCKHFECIDVLIIRKNDIRGTGIQNGSFCIS
jgi:hypothetical protein